LKIVSGAIGCTTIAFSYPVRPARLADADAANCTKVLTPLVMGSLLAIPTWVSPEKLGLTTSAGKEVFYVQDYGAYVVDDSGWDYNYINVERC